MRQSAFILFLLALSSGSYGQDKTAGTLEALRAPTAPAATVLSIQPNEVIRPKSVKDLEVALLSNYFGANNTVTIPNNFMLEAMPYWLSNRKNENLIEHYLSNKVSKVFWQNLSLSVASTQSYKIYDSVSTNALGMGFRSLLLRGKAPVFQAQLLNSLIEMEVIGSVNAQFTMPSTSIDIVSTPFATDKQFHDSLVAKFKKDRIYLNFSDAQKEMANTYLNQVRKKLSNNFTRVIDFEQEWVGIAHDISETVHKKAVETYQNFKTKREGWQVEIAGASALNFPTNQFEFSIMPKWGVWLTGTLTPKNDTKSKLMKNSNVVFMLRYMYNDFDYYKKYFAPTASYAQNNVDFGGRYVYAPDKISLELEVVARYKKTTLDKVSNPDGTVSTTTKSDWEWKYVLNVNYSVSPNTVITYTIGKHLQPGLSVSGDLVSTIGLNLGFGGKLKEPKMQATQE